MTARKYSWVATIAAALAAVAFAWPAQAFVALGGFDEFEVLRNRDWRLVDFDTNQDGDVTEGEGLEYLILTGPFGFTPDEIEQIRAAARVWENVPTSYAAFRNTGLIQDPLEATQESDLINYVTTNLQPGLEEDVTGVLGDVLTTFSAEETVFPDDGTIDIGVGVPVTAGTVLDVDIVIQIEAFRGDVEGLGVLSLDAAMVQAFGIMLGLGRVGTNNIDEPAETNPILIERAVLASRDINNQQVLIGATPSMFLEYFYTDYGNGELRQGWADLAPDDIAGVTFLYPSGNLSNFFSLSQRVRTQTREGLPSLPLPGAQITAWLDHDNDRGTSPIPVFGCLSGMYESATFNPLTVGDFEMYNMFKRIEVPGSDDVVDANYIFTANPLNGQGYTRQQPPTYILASDVVDNDTEAAEIDETFVVQGSAVDSIGDFTSAIFPSEVFNEFGNIFDVSNFEVGTAFRWDEAQRTLVSLDTGATIEQILERRFPMFGDPNDVCPLTIVTGGTGTGTDTGGTTDGGTGNDNTNAAGNLLLGALFDSGGGSSGGGSALGAGLRSFRDEVMLRTTLGAAAADFYYSLSPRLMQWVSGSRLTHALAHGLLGVYQAAWKPALGLLAVCLFFMGFINRRRSARAAAATAALALMMLWAAPAGALMYPVTTERLIETSDAIVVGTITDVTSRWVSTDSGGERIVTDITLTIDDTVKGGLNKQSTISFRQLGGRVGDIVTTSAVLPQFKEGEYVLLYLVESEEFGFSVQGARQGKFSLSPDKATGGITIRANAPAADRELQKAAAATGEAKSADPQSSGQVSLSAYIEYVRGLMQAAEAKSTETETEEAAR